MVNLQIRIDEELKNQAQQVAGSLGMDLTTAVRVFLKQMVNDHALPFRPQHDPFYSESNQKALAASLARLNAGERITKNLSELERLL